MTLSLFGGDDAEDEGKEISEPEPLYPPAFVQWLMEYAEFRFPVARWVTRDYPPELIVRACCLALWMKFENEVLTTPRQVAIACLKNSQTIEIEDKVEQVFDTIARARARASPFWGAYLSARLAGASHAAAQAAMNERYRQSKASKQG